jgi:glycosyltransferase involved in cell wall biosynthesis
MKQNIKVALVHDFLREYGGAERVLEALHQIFPQAPVYVAFLDKQALGKHWQRFKDWDICQTWFSKIPWHKKLYSPLRFLAPKAFADLDLGNYDLVISSSNAFEAKAVHVPHGKHVCYCHTPPRALYGYSTMSNWKKNSVIKFFGQLINHYMRVIDFKYAQQVDLFIANSEETQARIKKFYRRESIIVYPPVSLALTNQELQTSKTQSNQDYYFYIGRLGLQKHPELAVQAANELGFKLKIAGTGPMLARLQQMAGSNIDFLGAVTDEKLAELYVGAKALLYPVEDEDFGIVPVEALLAGTPVIAHKSGGPASTVQPGINGVLFKDLSKTGLIQAIQEFENINFKPDQIRRSAQIYTKKEFQFQIQKIRQDLF